MALALGYDPLLRQLLVHLLPASAAAGHDLLLRQDPVGSASCGQAGELAAHVTFSPFPVGRLRCSACVSAGQRDRPVVVRAEGGPRPAYGGLHGDWLPVVLDALRGRGDAGFLWTARSGDAYRQFNPLRPGEDEHCPQPGYLCSTQPPGNSQSLKISAFELERQVATVPSIHPSVF